MREGETTVPETSDSTIFKQQNPDEYPVGFCVIHVELDADGEPVDWTFVHVNERLAKLENSTPEDMVGHRFSELFPDRNRARLLLHYEAAYHGKQASFDDISEEMDRFVHIDVFPVGKEGYCACALYDLKNYVFEERTRQAEKDALHEAYEKQYRLNKLIQQYSKALDINFPLVITADYTNDTYEYVEYEGFLDEECITPGSIDDMVRGGASTLPNPEEAKEFWRKFNRQSVIETFRSGQTTIEVRHWQNSIDGKVHYMDTFAICTELSDDSIQGILLSKRIDDAAERDYAWHVADERMEVVDGIATICSSIIKGDLRDHSYKVVKCSEGMRVAFDGQNEGDFDAAMGVIADNVIRPDMSDAVREFIDLNTLDERMGQSKSIFMDYATCDNKWIKGRFVVLSRDEAGHVERILYLAREFTEEKERELDYLAKLESAAEEADRANRSKTDFLRRMSHDIRTPLNGIIGMLRIMKRNEGNKEKYEECMDKIVRSSDYLLSIVNDVLDVSKMESGGIVLEYKPFDLGQLLLNTLPIVAANASQNSVLFTGGRDDTHIAHRYLIGSPVHLNRVLMNIASNAVKYNRRGGTMKIYCNELQYDGETAEYEFVCEDTGLGMSEEFQKHAFEPLAREGKQTTTGFSGSGLGLSIVKDIVTRMGGTIELHSQENVGTTIRIVIAFPLDKNHEQTEVTSGIPEKLDLSGMCALLVEDNEINTEIARIMLEDVGLSVVCVENGQAAIDAFSESKPYKFDFVFMDVMMPIMDGLEATRIIRAMNREDAGSVPIIAMTANAFADDRLACLDVGMNDHVGKPTDPAEIARVLTKFLNK
jgi:signal transduction histidine kinase/ActR/RegA family two-component response regulator